MVTKSDSGLDGAPATSGIEPRKRAALELVQWVAPPIGVDGECVRVTQDAEPVGGVAHACGSIRGGDARGSVAQLRDIGRRWGGPANTIAAVTSHAPWERGAARDGYAVRPPAKRP